MHLFLTFLPIILIVFQIVTSLTIFFNFQHMRSCLYGALYGNILVGGTVYLLLIKLIMEFFNVFFNFDNGVPFVIRLAEPLTGQMFLLIMVTIIVPAFYFKHVTLPMVRDANFLLNTLRKAERPKEKKFGTPKNSFPMD